MTNVSEFVKACELELAKEKLNDGDYCVIIYSHHRIGGKIVRAIYKNLDEFKQKADERMREIDSLLDVLFQFWVYD